MSIKFGVSFEGFSAQMLNMIPISMPKENSAVGLGMNAMLRNLGGAIGPALATTIISTYYETIKVPVLPYVYEFGNKTAFNTIFAIGIGLMLLIIALSVTVKNYRFSKNAHKTQS